MATFYVSKSGDAANDGESAESPMLTITQGIAKINASVMAGGDAANTLLIGDGTYTETVQTIGSNTTLKGQSEDRSLVIITQSSGATIKLARSTTGNVFQHLTIQNTDGGGNDSGIYGASGGSNDWASYTIEDCILDCQGEAIKYAHACTIRRTKFLVNGGDTGSTVYGIHSGTAASGEVFTIESCLFVGWDVTSVNGSGGYLTVRNCTMVLADTTRSTCHLQYWAGTNVSVYNSIFYGGNSDVDHGLRLQSANSSHTVKNCISFGVTDSPFTNTGSPTVSSQLETNTEVASDGNPIFTAIGDAGIDDDYTIDSSGLAYQRGLAAELPSHGKDVDGNDFDDSTPNIGCYATTGWSAGNCIIANGSINKVGGVAKTGISKVIGV